MQEIKEKQVEQLKAEIRSRRADNNRLGNMDLCREELLTFDMLERYPLVTDQSEYTFRWHLVDALYQFVERIPAWVVDDEIMGRLEVRRGRPSSELQTLENDTSRIRSGIVVIMGTCMYQ